MKWLKVILGHSFCNQSQADRGSMSSYYNIAGLISEVSEEEGTQIAKNCRRRHPPALSFDAHAKKNPRERPHIPYIPIGLHLCRCYSMGLSSFKFVHGLQKTHFFCNRVRFGRSRSSKVEDFCTNRKRVCDFLFVPIVTMVLSCTVSEIRRLIGQ